MIERYRIYREGLIKTEETTTRGAAPDPGHLSCPPKKDGAKKGAPMKIPAAFSGGLGTALKLAPQGRVHHYQNGASDSHRGLTLRTCRPPGIFKGDGIQTEEKQGGVVTADYVRTMNIDEPLARFTPNSSRFYKQDALGSVIALTDETGVVRTTYTYDPFGNTTVSGEVSDNPFQYTGRENDQPVMSGVEGGLYYYRARYYSPALQRFISEDPIGLAGGINQFTYVHNNPMRFIDPLGLDYLDLNFNIAALGMGITGGIQFDQKGNIYPYIGVGFIFPPGFGLAQTYSNDEPTLGYNVGYQYAYGYAGGRGYSVEGVDYSEKGIGSPGFAVTSYYVFGPINLNKKHKTPVPFAKCH